MGKFIQERVPRVPKVGARACVGFAPIGPLSGNLLIAPTMPTFLLIDGGGAHRDVELPAINVSAGMWFSLSNTGGTHNLVVKYGGVTLGTMTPGDGGNAVCNGVAWVFID